MLEELINRGISASNFSLIFYASFLLLLAAGIRNLFTFTQGFWSEKASQSAAYQMRSAIFARLAILSFSYHDQAQRGQYSLDTLLTLFYNSSNKENRV
ncbi:MAG TPA: hypothetical protein VEH81_03280 [Ktedonobacteraceae bacterium]|nr:hypothetical protein [Ktedonobacteraceae bacterium]